MGTITMPVINSVPFTLENVLISAGTLLTMYVVLRIVSWWKDR